MKKKINVVLVGMGFGGAFLPIYLSHPNVSKVGIYDLDGKLTDVFKDAYPIDKVYTCFEEILADKEVDAVHLVTPINLHAQQTVSVLKAGKHCACTVPMATTLEDIRKIVETVRSTGKIYMMMETALYTYHYLYVKELVRSGKIGKIQFLRGSHYQDMTNWPDYWKGLPPMWYATHAISPMAAISGSRAAEVQCVGSGSMDQSLCENYGNPYPIESAQIFFENGLKGEATRSLFETARVYQEGLFVYGSKASFEWGFADEDKPCLTTLEELSYLPLNELSNTNRGRRTVVEQLNLSNYYENLPEELWKYTVGGNYDPLNPQDSLSEGAGAGHHGSHPHLVHEFVKSMIEDRKPFPDENIGANITAAGVCAHISAMQGGARIKIPQF